MTKLLVFTFLLIWTQYKEAIAATKPNILFFLIDDLGWNDTSYQCSDIETPTIDKFAKEGIRLQQYYVQRASMLACNIPHNGGALPISHGLGLRGDYKQPSI